MCRPIASLFVQEHALDEKVFIHPVVRLSQVCTVGRSGGPLSSANFHAHDAGRLMDMYRQSTQIPILASRIARAHTQGERGWTPLGSEGASK